jgi:hypothetical protein
MPHFIQLFVDPTFDECATCQPYEMATCHQTTSQMFNLHSCNLVEIVNIFSLMSCLVSKGSSSINRM